jgi:hypothetical protein
MANVVASNSTPSGSPSPFRKRNVAPAERVGWDEWRKWFASEWKQDEHVSIIGPTGTGKTALAVDLLKIRRFVVFVMTKPDDPKLVRALDRLHYVKVPAFPKAPPDDIDRYFLWPPGSGDLSADGLQQQRTILRDAFVKIFRGPRGGLPGRWCICLDEARYVADPSYLGLRREVNQLLIQGRSLRISVVLNFQRPSWVPPEAYDQASHLFIAMDNDRRNVQRFREIGGVDGDRVAATVQSLKLYEWCHVDSRPGKGTVQIIQMPKGL